MRQLKRLVKDFMPPVLARLAQGRAAYGFYGDYKTWEEAKNASTGYDSDLILNKVRDALLKVKKGEAVCERDSVLFDEAQYPWMLLTGLLRAALSNSGHLRVMDIGGSFGSTYFQCKRFLHDLKELRWCIVEQKKFVECGIKDFEDEYLKFYCDAGVCIKNEKPNVIILSCAIQYLEKPYAVLEEILDKGVEYIIFDRTAFVETGNDRLTVQKVFPEIYEALIPAWFLSKKRFTGMLEEKYELIAESESDDSANIPAKFLGFIYRNKGA